MYLQCKKARCDLAFIMFNVDGFNAVCWCEWCCATYVWCWATCVWWRTKWVARRSAQHSTAVSKILGNVYLGYRSDLYLNPCLWYQIIKHGKFMNTPILMAYEMQLALPRAVQCNLASWTLFDLFCRLIFHAMATHNSSLCSSLQLVVSSLKADAKIALVGEANKFARALDFL